MQCILIIREEWAIKIFNNPPKDWRDLQNKAGSIFRCLGYEIFIEKNIKTVRGTVNVDVFARDRTNELSPIHICECKHWNNRVPKNVVHSFRTVITDFGVNFAYIISKSGYQAGAFEAAKNSNINLLTWDEFLVLFEEKWLRSMVKNLDREGLPLREYTDLLSMQYFKQVCDSHKERFNTCCWKLRNMVLYTLGLLYEPPKGGNYKNYIDSVIYSFINNEGLEDIHSYDDFFQYMLTFCREAKEFMELEFGLILQ